MNKQWRYFLLLLSILAIGIAVLLWIMWRKIPEKPEMPYQIVQEPQSYEPARRSFNEGGIGSRKSPQEKHSFRFFDTFTPIVKPFEELILHNPLSPPYIKGEDNEIPPLKVRGAEDFRGESSGELSNRARGITENPLSSSDPIFKKLYPDYYLDALKVLHRVMANDGFVAATSLDISDEDALFAFLGATIDYAEIKNFIARADAERFRKALHGKTRELLRQERYSFLKEVFDYFNISHAFASIITGPECYSDPYPFNIIPGVNLPFDYCCNCGLICTKVGPPVFVPDCSIKKCDVPLGCLNLICPIGNAIWDPLTGICGCDNPVSAAKNIPSILKNALNCIAPKQPAPPIPPPLPPPPPSTP